MTAADSIPADSITFYQHRWHVRIVIHHADQPDVEYIASADRGLTYGDGIWFGDRAEYDEAEADA